jgi:hypothetical protein
MYFLDVVAYQKPNQPVRVLETDMVLEMPYLVWLANISGVVQDEDAPRTGTMELHSG